MKKLLSFFVLLALLLQTVPVVRWAVDGYGTFCALVDEEVPAEKSKEAADDRPDDKLTPHPVFHSVRQAPLSNSYNGRSSRLPASPCLQQHTPPPNVC